VRLFCIVDALTNASMLPGINGYFGELRKKRRLRRSRRHWQYVKAARGHGWNRTFAGSSMGF
jgi:hypothetical protein